MTQLTRISKKIKKLRAIDPEYRIFGAKVHQYLDPPIQAINTEFNFLIGMNIGWMHP